jgi:hypothetical protein
MQVHCTGSIVHTTDEISSSCPDILAASYCDAQLDTGGGPLILKQLISNHQAMRGVEAL